MIIAPTITPIGLGSVRLEWTGTAGATVRVFINGLLSYGPTAIATADKSAVVGLPDPGTIEVHENEALETVTAAGIKLQRKPLAWWTSVSGASHYRVYVDDTLVGSVTHEPSRVHHEINLPVDVRQDGGAWAGLRIEAVSSSGSETTSQSASIFVPGVPTPPSALEVSGGSGVFDVALTL